LIECPGSDVTSLGKGGARAGPPRREREALIWIGGELAVRTTAVPFTLPWIVNLKT
jgi:hypothetical protein